MATTSNIEIQDSNGNVYYPHTDASVVKYNSTTVKAQLDALASQTSGQGASMVGVCDSAGHFVGTTVEAVLAELFTSASSGKSAIATAAGSPSVSSETFSQLSTDIINGKNNINSAIVAKGITPTSKNFSDLVSAIGNISTGKKFASGTVPKAQIASYNFLSEYVIYYITVTGLTFTPSLISLNFDTRGYDYGKRTNICIRKNYGNNLIDILNITSNAPITTGTIKDGNYESFSCQDFIGTSGFSIALGGRYYTDSSIYSPSSDVDWIAYE